jgi:hypothetical protein
VKKLVLGVLVLALLQPIPVDAFFNRDCSNLKKRTIANQVKYEKAWNAHQLSLEKLVTNSKFSDAYSAGQPALARMKALIDIQITIIEDLMKFPKCRKNTNQSGYAVAKQKLIDARTSYDGYALFYKAPFMELSNFTKELK